MRGVREMCGELSRPRDPDCAGQTSGNFGGGKKGGVSQKGVHFLLLLPGNVSHKGDFGEKGAVGEGIRQNPFYPSQKFSSMSLSRSSANRELAHANQGLEYFSGAEGSNDSCI